MNMFWQQIYWREPLWLLLALFPVIIMFWRMLQQRQSLRRYADAELLPWVIVPYQNKQRYWQLLMQFLIWILFAISAAGPRLLLSAPQEILPSQNAAIIIVDQSRSMQANDVFPNRLSQSHSVVSRWVVNIKDTKLGLIIFAGGSHVVLPPTSDKQILEETAVLLPGMQLPTHGSAIVESLQQAKELLLKEIGDRAVILLTDGDVEKSKLEQLEKVSNSLQVNNITLHIIGVGLPSAVALTNSRGGWVKYKDEIVQTRLNESELQKIAENDSVSYQRLNKVSRKTIDDIWQPSSARILDKHHKDVFWEELFLWFLLPAIFLMVLNQITLPRFVMRKLSAIKTPLLIVCVFGVCLMLPPPVLAYEKEQENKTELLGQAYLSWQKKEYTVAAQRYAQISGYAARMGEGASCFRDNQVTCAITAFSLAAWDASTDKQRGEAAYNLANSFFKKGDFESAITLYKDALRYQPKQKTYQNNLIFSEEVQRNIEYRKRQDIRRKQRAQKNGWKALNVDSERVSDANLMLGEESENEPLKSLTHIHLTNEQLAHFMQRSESFAQLSSGKNPDEKRQHDWSWFSNKDPVEARKIEYWQRLFELEENIPAHPDEPETLLGVRPW